MKITVDCSPFNVTHIDLKALRAHHYEGVDRGLNPHSCSEVTPKMICYSSSTYVFITPDGHYKSIGNSIPLQHSCCIILSPFSSHQRLFLCILNHMQRAHWLRPGRRKQPPTEADTRGQSESYGPLVSTVAIRKREKQRPPPLPTRAHEAGAFINHYLPRLIQMRLREFLFFLLSEPQLTQQQLMI